jgi:hypothetical protein
MPPLLHSPSDKEKDQPIMTNQLQDRSKVNRRKLKSKSSVTYFSFRKIVEETNAANQLRSSPFLINHFTFME